MVSGTESVGFSIIFFSERPTKKKKTVTEKNDVKNTISSKSIVVIYLFIFFRSNFQTITAVGIFSPDKVSIVYYMRKFFFTNNSFRFPAISIGIKYV